MKSMPKPKKFKTKNMSISNPCTWFAGGGSFDNLKSFTYPTVERPDFTEGATVEEVKAQCLKEAECPRFLWHFSPHDNGLSRTMENNIVWFANTHEDAMRILREMFEFRLKCAMEQEKYYQGNEYVIHREEFSSRQADAIAMYRGYLKHMDKGKLTISRAPVNQFYEVGWASNDTLR